MLAVWPRWLLLHLNRTLMNGHLRLQLRHDVSATNWQVVFHIVFRQGLRRTGHASRLPQACWLGCLVRCLCFLCRRYSTRGHSTRYNTFVLALALRSHRSQLLMWTNGETTWGGLHCVRSAEQKIVPNAWPRTKLRYTKVQRATPTTTFMGVWLQRQRCVPMLSVGGVHRRVRCRS